MNLNSILFLAQVKPDASDPNAIREALKPTQMVGNTEIIIVLGCALGLSILLFIWAFFIRKRPKTARGSLVVERRRKGSRQPNDEDASRRRKRIRRPDHPDNWGRNPTLSETGGLPPARSEEEEAQANAESNGESDSDHDTPPDGPRIIRPR